MPSLTAADLVFAGVPGPDLDRASAAHLAENRPGGVVLLGRNFKTLEQLATLVGDLRRILPEAILSIDAEGGRVDRLRGIVASAPAASSLAGRPPGLALEAGRWVAHTLRLFDFDMDLAPVVDLDRGRVNNALDRRCFGATPAAVVPRAGAFLRGLHAGGVGGCIKHFPGLGAAAEDTHLASSTVLLPQEELATDLEPFAALAGLAGAVMVGHAAYPAYDPSMRPATLSPEILGGLLRGRLGFPGLVLSDDLEMKALASAGTLAERAEMAFAAGCDVVLCCHDLADLPEVIARLGDPRLAARREEALERLDVYRQRLETLKAAREHTGLPGEAGQGDRLEAIRAALARIRTSAGEEERQA